jgi:hypothetical protein
VSQVQAPVDSAVPNLNSTSLSTGKASKAAMATGTPTATSVKGQNRHIMSSELTKITSEDSSEVRFWQWQRPAFHEVTFPLRHVIGCATSHTISRALLDIALYFGLTAPKPKSFDIPVIPPQISWLFDSTFYPRVIQ